jgi:hypothetical protein
MQKLVTFLLLAQVTLAAVNIIGPKAGGTFYLGEQIPLSGTIQSNSECSGYAYLLLDGQNISSTEHAWGTGEVVSFESLFGNPGISAGIGTHTILVEGDCTESADVSFSVTDQLDIIYEINTDQLMTGDALKVTAKAAKRGVPGDAASILIGNNTFLGSATYSFNEAGTYAVTARAADANGNHGETSLNVQVYSDLVVIASIQNATYAPGDKIAADVAVKDHWGKPRSANVTAKAFGQMWTAVIDGSGTLEFLLPYSAQPGRQSLEITAVSGANTGGIYTSINVKEISDVSTSVSQKGNTTTVSTENKGNRAENVTITVCDASHCKDYTIELNPGESKKTVLDISGDAEMTLKYGNTTKKTPIYSAITGAATSTFFKDSGWLWPLSIILTFTVVWYVLAHMKTKNEDAPEENE